MSRLTDLLAQVARLDPTLGADLGAEVKAFSRRRPFGLTFERHRPESVEMPGRPVRRGDKVRVVTDRDPGERGDRRLWFVARIADGGASLVELTTAEQPERRQVPVADLVVVAEFRDPIYPGLVSTGRVERGGDKPFHTVINAENFHALEALLYTHESKVDAIYVDPPYNTGNQGWIYNDQYVAGDDGYKHSKWLAFMERRLLLAKRLLAPTGVIIVAIGDDEHHRLRMLMDQVFGVENFVSDVVWQGGRKNDSRYVSNGADYMLIYARDEATLQAAETRWREKKPGVEEALEAARGIWSQARGDHARATATWRTWMRSFKASGAASDAVTRFTTLDLDGRPIRTDGSIASPNPRPNLTYPLTHPRTGARIEPPRNGWRYSREEMARRIAAGLIVFGTDETRVPTGKTFLDAMDSQVPESVFVRDRNPSGRHLEAVLGERRFPNAKDPEVLMRWLRLVAPDDAVILDFFGGSGSTTEAVMRLNEEDGGTRQSILITNNEVAADDARRLRRAGHRHGDAAWEALGVYEHVAKPRISAVATGVRPDGSSYSAGLGQNVEFFTLTYEAPRAIAHHKAFPAIAPLLWLRAGAVGRRIEEPNGTFDVAETYGVLFGVDAAGDFAAALHDGVRIAYVVTDDERAFQMICADLPEHVEPVRLYESYLARFRNGAGA